MICYTYTASLVKFWQFPVDSAVDCLYAQYVTELRELTIIIITIKYFVLSPICYIQFNKTHVSKIWLDLPIKLLLLLAFFMACHPQWA